MMHRVSVVENFLLVHFNDGGHAKLAADKRFVFQEEGRKTKYTTEEKITKIRGITSQCLSRFLSS